MFSAILARKETFKSTYLNEEIIDLLSDTFMTPESYTGQVVPIDRGYDARPDLVSNAVYNDDTYMDILNKINGTGNPFELIEDQWYTIPGIDELPNFYVLPAKEWSEDAIQKAASKPKAKKKNEKRKPNEAVLGDKRFNIDKQSKIVIY